MIKDFVFTSESVTAGHPDKLCDQISDAIVDRFLQQDATSRVRAECAVSGGVVFIAARFASTAEPDLPEVARNTIRQVGHTAGEFNADDCTVMTNLIDVPTYKERAPDISRLNEDEFDTVTPSSQVTVFGFACNQTPELMPLPIMLAHGLARALHVACIARTLPYLMPDGKTQVGVEYVDGKPERIHSINLIASHLADQPASRKELQEALQEVVIGPVFRHRAVKPDNHTRIFVNPGGPVVGGGPAVHSGLTGRKTAVDAYGEHARHSGDTLSGKDAIRIDRVAAYAARHAAKNVVSAGLAGQCELQLSYSIAQARPVSNQLETFGTGAVEEEELLRRVREQFDFRPAAIIQAFNLQHLPAGRTGGFYQKLACATGRWAGPTWMRRGNARTGSTGLDDRGRMIISWISPVL